jgi:methionine synthase II (cobalamin-independent)
MSVFKPECRPLLIGSLPVADHNEALDLVLASTPRIPLWAQLPVFQEEGMVPQYMPGMPGLVQVEERWRVDTGSDAFEAELTRFYEDYLQAAENETALLKSRFGLAPDVARGFHVFMERVGRLPSPPLAVKGQVTGPVTFGLGLKDRQDRPVFYDLHARDAAVKLLALKAAWQVARLKTLGVPVIVFVDEPALAGYGSSELISISGEEITAALDEVFAAIHQAGGLAGIHVCANTDWGLLLNTTVDVVNFDAYGYAERFLLYTDQVRDFLARDGLIAWGIVPTGPADVIDQESVETLVARWQELMTAAVRAGLDPDRLRRQSFITPSCGTGSLSVAHARKVLDLTREVARAVRGE